MTKIRDMSNMKVVIIVTFATLEHQEKTVSAGIRQYMTKARDIVAKNATTK